MESKPDKKQRKRTKCEVYSRVCGYLRPTVQWNEGKQEEFKDRKLFAAGNCVSRVSGQQMKVIV